MEVENMFRNKKAVMMSCNIYDFKDLVSQFKGRLGDDPVFVGFPGVSGNSSVIMPVSSVFAISAKSENQEGAWQFVRQYLTEEYQREIIGFPVNKMIFEERAMEATKSPYTIDRNGNKQEYEYKMSIGGESVVLPNMTTEQVDEFIEFVESIDKCVYYDEDIDAIINEEVALFFAGQRPRESCCGKSYTTT